MGNALIDIRPNSGLNSVVSLRDDRSKPSIRLNREQRKLLSKKKELSEGGSDSNVITQTDD